VGNKSKNNNYLLQGTILVIASFIARAIGMIYRIPLTNILGNKGNAYYSTANEIYTIMLFVSAFSLPLAVSKLVSERLHRGEKRNAYRVFKCAIKFALVSGGILSILTFALAGFITKDLMSNELAHYALRVLAPAIFICAVVGVFRGFFQGHGTMVPTAVSQVVEQIVNAVVSVVFAGILMNYGLKIGEEAGNTLIGPAFGAAGGTFGTVASLIVALIFMLVVYMSYRRSFKRQMRRDTTNRRESERSIYLAILSTIFPIVLSTILYNISTVLDQGIFNKILGAQGYTVEQYNDIWGIFTGKFKVLMNVPLSIASCLAPSVVPSLTAAMQDKNWKDARMKVRDTIRYTMIFTIPCAVGLAALASPIMTLIFNDSMSLTAGIMRHGALMIILYGLSTLTTGILQGLGKLQIPLINTLIALVLHIIALFVMLQQFKLNIYGVVYANILFALVVCVLNAYAIRRTINYRQEIKKTFAIPVIASLIMGIAAFGVHFVFNLFAGNAISTILAILAGVVVYVVLLVKLRGISEKEILGFPKGTMIVRILNKCKIL